MIKTIIPDIDETVSRPIIFGVIRDLILKQVIPDVSVSIPGYTEYNASKGTTLEHTGLIRRKFSDSSRYAVTYNEIPVNDGHHDLLGGGGRVPNIFTDRELDVYMRPIYFNRKVEINVEYRAIDRAEARAWIDSMTYHMGNNKDTYLHALEYYYIIPPEYIVLLNKIYELRELKGGYGDSFKEFLLSGFSDNISLRSSLNADYKVFTEEVVQRNIPGFFDFRLPPDTNPKGNSANHIVNFTYTIEYNVPTIMVMDYPPMIHNTLLPNEYQQSLPEVVGYPVTFREQDEMYQYFRKEYGPNTVPKVITYPTNDTWEPPWSSRSVYVFMSTLLQVSTDDLRDVVNIGSLGAINLKDEVLDFIKLSPQSILEVGSYPIWAGIYVSGMDGWLDPKYIEIDNDLNVRLTHDMDIRRVYRICIGMVLDLTTINRNALDLMLANGEFTNLYLLTLEPNLQDKGLLPNIVNGTISEHEYHRSIRSIRYTNPNVQNVGFKNFPTLLKFGVQVNREST